MNFIEKFFTTIEQPKIYIHTPYPAISENVQNTLFKLGYHWLDQSTSPKYTSNKYVVVYSDCTNLYTNDYDDSDACTIEASVFFRMANPSMLKKLH